MSIEQYDSNEKLKQVKSRYKILVVEDNEIIQKFYMSALADLGYQYKIVPNGEQAIKEYIGEHFDLVLLDYNLPDISGVMVCKAMRRVNKENSLRVPIVMQTTQPRDSVGFVDIDGFYTKPIGYKELDELIIFHIGIKKEM